MFVDTGCADFLKKNLNHHLLLALGYENSFDLTFFAFLFRFNIFFPVRKASIEGIEIRGEGCNRYCYQR